MDLRHSVVRKPAMMSDKCYPTRGNRCQVVDRSDRAYRREADLRTGVLRISPLGIACCRAHCALVASRHAQHRDRDKFTSITTFGQVTPRPHSPGYLLNLHSAMRTLPLDPMNIREHRRTQTARNSGAPAVSLWLVAPPPAVPPLAFRGLRIKPPDRRPPAEACRINTTVRSER